MKLRSGKLRLIDRIRQISEGKSAKMVNDNQSASGSKTQMLTHHLVQKTPQITSFAGRVNGVCSDVEYFIESVEQHLNSLSNVDDNGKFLEAKAHFDYTKGDLRNFTASWEFKQIDNWESLKKYLREVYGSVKSQDPVVSLSRILREQETASGDYIEFAGIGYNKLSAWVKTLEGSDWVQNGQISVNNLASLLHLSTTLKYLPEGIVNSIEEKWKPSDGLRIMKERVEENMSKCHNLDLARIKPRRTVANNFNQPVSVVHRNENPQVNNRFQQHKNVQGFNTHKPIVCYNCQRKYHHERDCRSAPFCANHQIVGHRTDECRNPNLGNGEGQGYKRNFSQNYHNQQYKNYGHQGNYSRNYNQARPSSAASSHATMHHNNGDQYKRNKHNSSNHMSYNPSQQNFRRGSFSDHPL